MNLNRKEINRMIDKLPYEEYIEVGNFIAYLSLKRGREVIKKTDVNLLSNDEKIANQKKSREDRKNSHVFGKDEGLRYLHSKIAHI